MCILPGNPYQAKRGGNSILPFFPSLSDHDSMAILAVTKHVPGNQVPGKCPEPPVKQGIEPRELGSNPRFTYMVWKLFVKPIGSLDPLVRKKWQIPD